MAKVKKSKAAAGKVLTPEKVPGKKMKEEKKVLRVVTERNGGGGGLQQQQQPPTVSLQAKKKKKKRSKRNKNTDVTHNGTSHTVDGLTPAIEIPTNTAGDTQQDHSDISKTPETHTAMNEEATKKRRRKRKGKAETETEKSAEVEAEGKSSEIAEEDGSIAQGKKNKKRRKKRKSSEALGEEEGKEEGNKRQKIEEKEEEEEEEEEEEGKKKGKKKQKIEKKKNEDKEEEGKKKKEEGEENGGATEEEEEEEEEEGNADSNPKKKKKKEETKHVLFIGNLPFDATEEELREHFKVVAQDIVRVTLLTRQKNGSKGRGFGFLELANAAAYTAALKLNLSQFKTRKINVEFTTPGRNTKQRRTLIKTKTKKLLGQKGRNQPAKKNKKKKAGRKH